MITKKNNRDMHMKMTTLRGYDRQHTAAILLAHLGPSMSWHHQLMDYAKKGVGLHGSGPKLLPVAAAKGRPIYSHEAIYQFIEDAIAWDKTLGPRRLTPIMYEVPDAALAPSAYRIFRAVPAVAAPH